MVLMKEVGQVSLIVMMMMNFSLVVAGLFGFGFGSEISNFQETYKEIPDPLKNATITTDFQDDLIFRDDNNSQITDANASFLSNAIDLIPFAPEIASLFPLFEFVLNLLLTGVIGVTLVAIKLQLPDAIILFVGIFNVAILSFAALPLVRDLIFALTGGRV
ncbi:hypothetical protein LCGC14_2025280 [marine sediment metagenome]|uniref:Uncharacterized protein n=1 Tax=marine sediment metagenome TaxID=412755 RepID=A0A0F9FIV6_9ZZZZ